METKQLKQVGRDRKERGKKGRRDGEQRELLLGKYTSNKLMSRPVWYHNFSIQREVKLGSSSIDFFPGFVAVFLSTNSVQAFASPGCDSSVTYRRELFLE